MASASSQAGLETFEQLEINYEHAYGYNPLKKACVEETLALLPPRQRVLDVGCGTGKPVAEMLSLAGHDTFGIDISPTMIQHAKSRVKGSFIEADILTYQPEAEYAAVFVMFSLLQLTSFDEFYDVIFKYGSHVSSNGYLVLGTCPADPYVKDKKNFDSTGSYAVNYPVPFMGEPQPNLILTSQALVDFVESMGFKAVSNTVDIFYPADSRCEPEHQQYVIAQRLSDAPLQKPHLKGNIQ